MPTVERVSIYDVGDVPQGTGILDHVVGEAPTMPSASAAWHVVIVAKQMCQPFISVTDGATSKRWPMESKRIGELHVHEEQFPVTPALTYDIELDPFHGTVVQVDQLIICEVT